MSNINSIKKMSNRLLFCLWAVLFINPMSSALLWFLGAFSEAGDFFQMNFPDDVQLPLTMGQAISGYLITNITVVISMLITWQLIKLFKLYHIGKVFTASNIVCYHKIANFMILYVIMSFVEEILLGPVLTYGQENMSFGISVSDSNVALLIAGIIIRVIAKVMAEAKALNDEQSLTI